MLNYKNEPIFSSNYVDSIEPTWYGFRTFKDSLKGMINFEGKEVLKPEHNDIEWQEYYQEHGGFYFITLRNGKYGVTNMNGEEILPESERKILPLRDESLSYFIYENDKGKQGVIDKYGNLITDVKYKEIKASAPVEEPYFILWKNDKEIEIVNVLGKRIFYKWNFLKEITDVECLSDKYFAIEEIDLSFEGICDFIQNLIYDFNYHLCFTTEKTHIYNSMGLTCSKGYDKISRYNERYAYVRKDFKSGLITIDGKDFVRLMPDVDGFCSVTENGLVKFSYKNKNGIIYNKKIITEPKYEKIYFNRGHVFLRNGDIYDVASYKEFAKTKGKNLKRYTKQQLHFIDDKCFKFTKEDGTEDVYCDESK